MEVAPTPPPGIGGTLVGLLYKLQTYMTKKVAKDNFLQSQVGQGLGQEPKQKAHPRMENVA